jgi:threonine-phosphate decarboxylase
VLSALRTGAYDFLALCNPNNPTGALLPKQLLEEILRTAQAHHVFVLLDECFYDMVGTPSDSMSMIPQYRQYDNLLILKSMTKRYAIPGLRLGYGICGNDRIAACIQQTGQPWSVSTLAAAAGIAAVQAEAERQAFLRFLQPERQFLYQALRKLGFTVWQPHANFIFFHAKAFPDLEQRLLPYGILLRSCASYAGLDATYYRTAVRTREENLYLLACLNEIVEGGGTCTQNPL